MQNDQDVIHCVQKMIADYFSRKMGFELAIKAVAYELLVLLFRGYPEKVYSEQEHEVIMRNIKRFQRILDFLDSHYHETINIDQLAEMASVSKYHFCRLFKQLTGKTTGDHQSIAY